MTSTATASPPASVPPTPGPRSAWSKVGRATIIVVVAGLVAMWVYIFVFADPANVTRIRDTAWSAKAEPICAEALAEVRALLPVIDPLDTSPETLLVRADLVDRGNAAYGRMLQQLDALPAVGEQDAFLVTQWLKDWHTYLDDRIEYVDGLRDGSMKSFTSETLLKGGPISNYIGDVARDSRMLSCAAPPLT